jgi:hypothetical protein
MKKRLELLCCAIVITCSTSFEALAEDVVIDFEELTGSNLVQRSAPYSNSGFELSTEFTSSAVDTEDEKLKSVHAGSNFYSETVSMLTNYTDDYPVLTRQDGETFELISIDIDTLFAGNANVEFTGTKANGQVVVQAFVTDSNRAEMETFSFSGFTDLVSVSWNDLESSTLHHFDNINLRSGPLKSISDIPDNPEPAFLKLLSGGGSEENSIALTYIVPQFMNVLDVDEQGRIYFSAWGPHITRTELDGTVTDFYSDASDDIADFKIHGEYLYYTDRSSSVFKVHLETKSIEIITPLNQSVEKSELRFEQIALDSAANVYVSSLSFIYRIDASTREISHLAGDGNDFTYTFWESWPGDRYPVPATTHSLNAYDLAVDPTDDSLVIVELAYSDFAGLAFFRVDPETGLINSAADRLAEIEGFGGWVPRIYLDVLPDGDIVYSDMNRHIWAISKESETPRILAGNGQPGLDGDGKGLIEAAMVPTRMAADHQGNIFVHSISGFMYGPGRIRQLDLDKDVVSSVVGMPGYLACQLPSETPLGGHSVTLDSNGIVYMVTDRSIAAVDPLLEIVYPVAGVYGVPGYTEDGEPGLGNPISTSTNGSDILAIAPNGDLYFAEGGDLRRINHVTGNLETVAKTSSGEDFSQLRFNDAGDLFAIRQLDYCSIDVCEYGPPTLVRVDTEQGTVTDIFNAAEGVSFETFDVDSKRNFYIVALFDQDFGIESGLYVSNPELQTDIGLMTEDEWGPLELWDSELELDEKRGYLYFRLGKQVLRLSLESGDLVKIASTGDSGIDFPEHALEDALTGSFGDIALGPAGDLHLMHGSRLLKISSSSSSSDLLPDDVTEGALAGEAVARSGDWLAIGVPQSTFGENSSGEVLVYNDNGCRTVLRNRLVLPPEFGTKKFGRRVAFSGDSLIVAGDEIQTGTQSVSKPESDSPFHLGVFRQSNNNWSYEDELSRLVSSNLSGAPDSLVSNGGIFVVGTPDANNGQGEVKVFDSKNLASPVTVRPSTDVTSFGRSLALGESKLAIGADSFSNRGVAEIFQLDGSSLSSFDVVIGEQGASGFATALALNDTALYVGSPDSSGGRVYDYSIDAESVNLSDTLTDPDNPSNPSFGSSLALEGDVLLVGAPETNLSSSQMAPPSIEKATDNGKTENLASSGLVTAFGVKDGSGRRKDAAKLFSLFLAGAEGYGQSVDISNGRIVVGAPKTNNRRGTFESVSKVVNAADLSGLWYDPDLDGEGYNVLVSDAGMVVYFYGYDSDGERLWLISENVVGDFGFGEEINVPVYKAIVGEFNSPVESSNSLVQYGLLSMSFSSLSAARFSVTGFDGSKFSRAVLLADAGANEAAYSGLWYDPAKDGEGFNIISGEPGTVIYYYGSNDEGERLWLISDVLSNGINDGSTLKGKLYEATGGDFYHPEPSASALREWGTLEATFDSCNKANILLQGSDGSKTAQAIKLAGVSGSSCN